jgi:hypothetical protein
LVSPGTEEKGCSGSLATEGGGSNGASAAGFGEESGIAVSAGDDDSAQSGKMMKIPGRIRSEIKRFIKKGLNDPSTISFF